MSPATGRRATKQHETGEICREIRCSDGQDYWKREPKDPVFVHLDLGDPSRGYEWSRPTTGTHPPGHVEIDGLNDPCAMLWGELASYAITGDEARLRRILPAQKRWYEAFHVYLRDRNGLFITDWGSADNHPRNLQLGYGVDVAGQVVFFARLLARLCRLCGDSEARRYERDARALGRLVRSLMWDEATGFFHDLDRAGRRMEVKSLGAFYPMQAGAVTRRQAARLVRHLHDPREFDRPVLVPTIAASEPDYCPTGAYYHGGVWPFTNAMVIDGLERYGYHGEARRIAMSFWEASVEVYRTTGIHWEYLQPEARLPGRSAEVEGWNARPNFTGWGAWAPIALLIEQAIGLRVDAPSNTVVWDLAAKGRCGCRRLAFVGTVTDVVTEARKEAEEAPRITARTNRPYLLEVRWGRGRRRRMKVLAT